MYARSIVDDKLSEFRKKYGWKPEEHSVEEIDLFNKKLESYYVTDKHGDKVFSDEKLTPGIAHWMKNERALVALDCAYFLTRYFWLTENEIQRFAFRSGQKAFYSVVARLEEKGVSQEIQCLKARKQGISTVVEGLMTHSALYVPGARCSIGSADDQKTAVMMDMMYGALEHIPWYLRPTQTKDKRSGRALLQFARIGTSIVVQHGAMRGGIGQGTTPNKIHMCFAPETLMRSSDGEVLAVRDASGRVAIGGSGEETVVSALTLSHRKREITAELTPWGCYSPQATTLDHPVLTRQGWTKAGDCKKGTEVVFPVRPITDDISWSTAYHRGTGRTNKPPRQQIVKHDEALGWVCGLYVAEGHLHVNQRLGNAVVDSITFAMHEREVERNMEGLNKIFGDLKLKLVRRENSKTCQIHVRSAGWARWIEERFGRVKGKHIPDDVFSMGKDFCKGLLRGYLEGDGHILSRKVEIMATTVRQSIAFQLRDMTLSLGYGWTSMYNRESGVFYNRNCQETWTLMWAGESAAKMRHDFGWPHRVGTPALHWSYSLMGDRVYVQLKRVKRGFSELFYNVEVEAKDHAFCTAQMVVKNSECCDFTNWKAQIEEGLFKAVPSMPYVLMVLESTGNGNTGDWADYWRTNKEKYWIGRSRHLPLFLPWFMTPELYPTDHWVKKFPFPEGWRREECPEAIAMADKARAFVMSSPMLLEILGRDWILPDRQLWYWQYHYEEAKVRRMEKSWVRQMATDDYDALIGDNDSSFDRDSIIEIETNRQKTCQVYGILGEGIAEKHDPDPVEVDYTEPRISVDWKTVNDINLNWMLMPLRGDVEDTNFDPLKKLLVWFPPERGAKYSIGVDTGFGVGGDRSAIEVNRCGEGIVPDEQVAEFAADDITNVELYAWAMCIAAWYGKFMEDGETPRFVIEQRRKYGDSCYHALKLHGFRKHHRFRHYDKKTMRPIQSPNQPEGWWTNEWSRPMLLETYKYATANGWCKINSRFLLAEMEKSEQFVGSGGKIREDHVTGEHDDRKFAMAMAFFTWHDSDLMAERSKQRYNSPENEDVQIDYGQARMIVENPGSKEFFDSFS